MYTIHSLTKDERAHFIDKFGPEWEKLFTPELLSFTIEDIKKNFRTPDQYLQEIVELGTKYLELSYIGMMFPCKTIGEGGAVVFHQVRRVREEAENIWKQMHAIREKARRANDYTLDDDIWRLMESFKNEGIQAKREQWKQIKHQMYPPHLLAKRVEDDHEEALRLNARIDEDRERQRLQEERDALLAQLTPEQRALLQA